MTRAARRLGERRLGLLGKSASASAIAGGTICAAALGLALTAREMVNMRPFHYIYLNRFVDRETPEYPRALYDMSYWGISNLQGADFYITHCREHFRMSGVYGEPFAPVLHESRVYDNAVMSVLAVNLDMADDETRAAHREMKRDTLAGGKPTIRAEWDVYLRDGAPVYLKESSRRDDTRGVFDPDASPAFGREAADAERRRGSGGLSFMFGQYGVRLDGGGMIRRPPPGYPHRGHRNGTADSVLGFGNGLARFGSAAAGRGRGAGLRARI